jgi:hypothetical protein
VLAPGPGRPRWPLSGRRTVARGPEQAIARVQRWGVRPSPPGLRTFEVSFGPPCAPEGQSMAKRTAGSKIPMRNLSQKKGNEELRKWLEQIEQQAFLAFQGSMDDLERALGLLRLAPHFGWKPVVLSHSKATVAKYEKILGIQFREEFDAEGPSASRSAGFRIASKVSNFWKAVSGEDPALDRTSRKEIT